MRTIVSILIFFCCFTHNSNAQVYLNDTTIYNSDLCTFNGVFEVDSGFFLMGSLARLQNNSTIELVLGFHSNAENKALVLDDYELSNSQRVFGSMNDFLLNDRGNFVYFYRNCDTGVGCYPRLKEISPNGSVVFDSILQPLLDSANLQTLDFNNFIQKKDSTYLFMVNVWDTVRANAFQQGGGGVFAIRFDKNFNLIDTTRYFPNGAFIQRNYMYADIIEVDSGKVVLMIPETLQATNPQEEAKILFMQLDSQENIIDTSYYMDGQKIVLPFGFSQAFDKGYLFTYIRAHWDTLGNGWSYRDYIAKVDSLFNIEWRMSVDTTTRGASLNLAEQEIVKTLDGNFVVVGGSSNYVIPYQASAQISKFNETGDVLWQRKHFKIVDTSTIWTVTVEVKDVVSTSDSGYCMVGEVFDYPAFVAGFTNTYGFIVKTNCLGFLSNAVASASFNATNLDATFYNTSMQAGSYFWDFGDGTTLVTDEYADTVLHTYPFPSSASGGGDAYDVMLIAYGCYDSLGVRDADTLLFTVMVTEDGSSVVVTENGYFVLFPNPSSSGGELSIYLNTLDPNNGEVSLNIYSMDGKLAKKFYLSANEGTYMLNNDLAKGMYQVVLEQGGKGLQGEKLIIQ